MKKTIYLIFALLVAALGSCTFAPDDFGVDAMGNGESFDLIVGIEGMTANVTRSVAATDEEKTVHTLTLLFFEPNEDGSGQYLDYCILNNPLTGGAKNKVVFREGSTLSASKAYNILAVANIDQSRYLNWPVYYGSIGSWCASFAGKTQNQVMAEAISSLGGSNPGTVPGEEAPEVSIKPDGLVMNASAIKGADQELVQMTLTRNVSRIDVINKDDDYMLISASIWNANKYSRIWSQEVLVVPPTVTRFYGVPAKWDYDNYTMGDIKNQLYTFENFVYKPGETDASTTCIIVAILEKPTVIVGPPGGEEGGENEKNPITYHRINISPKDGTSQSLKRNMVYQVTIRDVKGLGAEDESEAFHSGKNDLNYVINYWDLDDGDGIIKFDGKNVLAVPVSKIQFTSDAEEREYSIFTFGEGTLLMSVESMDEGITATLTGNTLKVSATALPEGVERNGSLKFTFAGMQAEIAINQTEKLDNFLLLSTYSLPVFPKTAPSGLDNDRNAIKVDASGPWKAELRNNASEAGSKFSFSPSALVETLDGNDASVINNTVKLYTNSINAADYQREAFVLFKLKSDETIAQAAILTQKGNSEIVVTPQVDKVLFDPMAVAKTQTTFTVNPGETGGIYDAWTVDIVNASDISVAGNEFSIVNSSSSSTVLGNNKFTVIATKANFTGGVLAARIKITSGASTYYIPVEQEAFVLDINPDPSSKIFTLPVTGGYSEYIEVNIPEGMKWSATIVSNGSTNSENLFGGHKGYIENPENGNLVNSVSGMDNSRRLRIYLPKLLTPNVNITPEVKVSVSLEGSPLNKELVFQQNPLVARAIKVQSYNTGYNSYGIASTGANTTANGYATHTWQTMINTAYFGTLSGSAIKTKGAITRASAYLDSGSSTGVESGVTFVNANRANDVSATKWGKIDEWRKQADGNLLLVTYDEFTLQSGWTNYLNGKGYRRTANATYTGGSGYQCTRVSEDAIDSKLMQYLLKDGPFTGGTAIAPATYRAFRFHIDGASTKVIPGTGHPATAIPVLECAQTSGEAKGYILTMDLVEQFIFYGDCQTFYSGDSNSGKFSTPSSMTAPESKFFGNILSVWLNTVQYGSHWTDHFTGKAANGYEKMPLTDIDY